MNPIPKTNNNEDDAEPCPEELTPELLQPVDKNQKTLQDEEDNITISSQAQNANSNKKSNYPKSVQKSVRQNSSLNVSKAYTSVPPPNNALYENFDTQQMTYSIMKDYLQLRISKDQNFMERMKFDIYKRQIKEERINQLVEQNKIKIGEEDRVKAFNRLIEDSNRRIEAQENLENMKNKLEDYLEPPPSKKYKDEQWNEIYNVRFKRYKDEIDKRNDEKIKRKKEEERLKEENEIKKCKAKVASKEDIEKTSKRLYEESIKRRLKMEQTLSKINYENSPTKYKKIIPTNPYNFQSDDENEDNNYHSLANNLRPKDENLYRYRKLNSKNIKKNKKTSVTEYNNIRFDIGNNFESIGGQTDIYANDSNLHKNKFETKKEPQFEAESGELDNYLEDEAEIENIPQPYSYNPIGTNNTSENKIKKNTNQIKDNTFNLSQGNKGIEESDASKIVNYFFTKNIKGI